METLLNFFLHIDAHLGELISQYGLWIYGILFLIVFAETGLVVTPFLPGDSLLFMAGTLAAREEGLEIWLVLLVLAAAAIIGDAVNYSVGRFIGPRVFTADAHDSFWHRLLNRDHLRQAHDFFERYGGKAVVLGRFVPIVRTFVPFVAGAGAMQYSQFFFYNVAGGLLWVGLCVGGGYMFGNWEPVRNNFGLVALGIVGISLLPMLWGYLISRLDRSSAPSDSDSASPGK
jgi:membrane-associated protein